MKMMKRLFQALSASTLVLLIACSPEESRPVEDPTQEFLAEFEYAPQARLTKPVLQGSARLYVKEALKNLEENDPDAAHEALSQLLEASSFSHPQQKLEKKIFLGMKRW